MDEPTFAGAVPPERTRRFDSLGVALHLSEWGDPAAPPVVLLHGMFDNGRGFDLLAPLLAERFRVIAIDARGHGDSAWADAYVWGCDVLDVANVVRSLGRPAHLVGHSRGGGVAIDVTLQAPSLVRGLVSIDGFGPPPEGFAVPAMRPRHERSIPERCADFLDARRNAASEHAQRCYPALDDLVERRRAQNPRLTVEWLRYFVFHGARRTERGWTWKADLNAARGFGPWRPDWIGTGWQTLRRPMLAMIGSEQDTWGPLPESILEPRLRRVPDLQRVTVAGAGHFVHMEQPRETARALLDFLGR
ncbi:MAG: alpha/beta hydrolase [Thermodesulfobacteriota bacterium]